MHVMDSTTTQGADLKTFVRTRYFYGQLLDVFHFEMEQNYFNQKRWLLNRLVTGHGVVCGLDVQLGEDSKSVVVLPGVALDKAGREIVVPVRSRAVALPPAPPHPNYATPHENCDEGDFVHVCLCYHECESDPAPVLSGDCDSMERCAPSAIRERYKIVIKEGKAPPINMDCSAPDVISGGRINYQALAIRVTRGCPHVPDDTCIPLANVRLPAPDKACEGKDIDITVRPIVYSNDLLYELILALMSEDHGRPRGGKS